jgi:hypothetical protein
MKRIEVIEFMDFDWFPNTMRSTMTKLIVVLHRLVGSIDILSAIIADINKKTGESRIVDLGSGSGSSLPEVVIELKKRLPEQNFRVTLTDLLPDPVFVQAFNKAQHPNAVYSRKPLDATRLEMAPPGIKTLVNTFHHMSPKEARGILKSARQNHQSLVIYEMTDNIVPFWGWVLLLPLTVPIMLVIAICLVPFVKPLNWQDLFFTYIIPVIPIFVVWDSLVSFLRTYAYEDIMELLPESHHSYQWKIERVRQFGWLRLGYVVIGFPTAQSS